MSNRFIKSLLIVLVFSSVCPATQQICDRLIYDGDDYSGCPEHFPLEDYWSDEHPKPEFLSMTSTACYRGYIATWEVRNATLYLKSLSRQNLINPSEIPVPVQKVFPDVNSHVPANWFSGVFCCHREKGSYDRLFISVHNGNILGIRKATLQQLNNFSDEELSWSILLPAKEKAVAIDTRDNSWMDGRDMFSTGSSLKSRKSFKLRGIYFPGGKLWVAPEKFCYLLETPDSVEFPAIVTPVEVTAKSTGKHTLWEHLNVSQIKVLPIGAVIQHTAEEKNSTTVYVIILITTLAIIGAGCLKFILHIKKNKHH